MSWVKDLMITAWKGTKAAVRGTASVANVARRLVSDNRDGIAKAGKVAVSFTGKAVQLTGKAAKGAADMGASAANRLTATSDSVLVKTLGHGLKATAKSIAVLGRGVEAAGGMVDRSGGAVGDIFGGAVAGTMSVASELLDSVAIEPTDLASMRTEIEQLGERALARSAELKRRIDSAQSARRKSELLDVYVIGGVSLAETLRAPSAVPAEVESAFRLAYPGLASNESFADAVERLSPDELPGFVAGVKGKLFELEFVDYLNDGNLPEGLSASLASSATQEGWDVQIVDGGGQVVELLQAKATESVAYVREALERYPGIDVVTTEEVYAQLAALGMAEGVHNGGISEATLEEIVNGAAGDVGAAVDLLPSVVGLAVVGLSVFMDKSLSNGQRAAIFGERSGRLGVSSLAGKGLMLVTQTWWLGVIGGVSTQWLSSKGRAKREHYDALKDVLETMRKRERTVLQLTHAPG